LVYCRHSRVEPQNERHKHFPLDDAGRETRSRRWAGGPGKEGEPSPCSGLRYTHAPHLTRIVRRPIFSEGASRESGLPFQLAGPSLRSGPGLASQRLANASSPGTIFCECPPSLRSGSRVTSSKRVKRWTLTSFRSGPHVATGSSMLQVRARNPHCASGSRCTQWKHAGCFKFAPDSL